MKQWTIAIAAVAVLVAAALGTVYYVAGTPQYSLYLLKRAVRDHDRETFDRHFDVDRIVTSAIEREVGPLPAGPRIVSQKATDTLIPASDALIRERLDERFDDPDAAPVMSMSVDSVRYQNNAAFVTLRDANDGSTTTLTMERMRDRHWKVVDIDLAKANIQYSLKEARERAEALLPPETPAVTRPSLPPDFRP
jgi:hypothetical protein